MVLQQFNVIKVSLRVAKHRTRYSDHLFSNHDIDTYTCTYTPILYTWYMNVHSVYESKYSPPSKQVPILNLGTYLKNQLQPTSTSYLGSHFSCPPKLFQIIVLAPHIQNSPIQWVPPTFLSPQIKTRITNGKVDVEFVNDRWVPCEIMTWSVFFIGVES